MVSRRLDIALLHKYYSIYITATSALMAESEERVSAVAKIIRSPADLHCKSEGENKENGESEDAEYFSESHQQHTDNEKVSEIITGRFNAWTTVILQSMSLK